LKPPGPGLETVACDLCGEQRAQPFARRQGMQVVRCLGCGLVYVSPRLDAEALHRHYNSGESSRTQYYLDVEVADRRSFAEVLDRAERLIPPGGDLLDIGPNVGTCLVVARDRGWRVHGIEINAEAARYCRETRGLDVITGTLEAETYPPGRFDVVLMGDVIEHVASPADLMRTVARILRPGGAVLISTPDIGGWAARLLQVKPVEHIYYFDANTMERLVRGASLELVGIAPLDRYHNLTAMVHSTTFWGLFQALAPVFRAAHRVFGDVVVKLPLRENLLAVARKPVPAP
jgi:2-polyprenyl-3-methyl-5-hydroxy-6-metoxy-1,4-benzoquinol methylase